MTSRTYDASARLTPANVLTVARLLFSPVLFAMVLADGPTYGAFALGFVIAATDGVDGYLARKMGATRSGAFLDPLADKVLVLGTMASLVNVGVLPLLPVLLIAVRELGISVYRSYWAKRSLAIPARKGAKVKTVVQEAALGFGLLPPFGHQRPAVAVTVLWIAVALTLWTGLQYVWDGRQAMSTTGSKSA
ncbi:MAG: CDP-alcohol phosphatidyltransferase family protein [Acidimicrobiales bacterium]|nr:CDP-alcohol phosphatidyltransferase family protein [Acidimicrobiales bacterium]